MTVISISITESEEQLVAGFPRTISLSTNVPSTIFYTTDNSVPTTLSTVYVSPIVLPTNINEFILKVFATNGIDYSPVITNVYSTNILDNTRLPHSATTDLDVKTSQSTFPFGSNSPSPVFDYLNSANSGTTVNNPNLPGITFGYDASGNPISANKAFDDYLNVYSTTNYKNQVLPYVGNLPGTVTVIGRRSPLEYHPQESDRSNSFFNSRAMVIFQDSTTEDPTNPPQINPQAFSLENVEITKDGSVLQASGLDTPTITGSFLRQQYNPRTQMITNYYRDSSTNRWIISSFPYEPKNADQWNFSGMVFGREQGAGRVYSWNQFRYRTLT